MTRKSFKSNTPLLLAGVMAAFTLAGCVTNTLVPAGPYKVGETQITLGREWSDMSAGFANQNKKLKLLTVDGPLLNRLYVSDGLVAGDYLVRPTAKDKPTPTIRAGMTTTERVEFVVDSIAAMGYERVESAQLRPGTWRGERAARFDINARTLEGLDIAGTGLIAEKSGKVHVILFLAPAEHYFGASQAEVDAVIASVAS